MSKVRVVFLGTPDFAVTPLMSMAKDDHFQIVEVITQPDRPKGRNMQVQSTPVKEAALKLELPVRNTESVNTPEFIAHLKSLKADVAVVIAFGQIVSEEFLKLFPFGAVNVHGSLLPKWRGAAPIQRSVEAGDKETGVALQIVVKALDAGAILGVRKIPLSPRDTSASVYEKLKNLSSELLEIELMDYIRGNLMGEKQDESKVTIAKKLKKEEGIINWQSKAEEIFNKIRAFDIWPGTWTYWNKKQLKILSAEPAETKGAPGKVIRVEKDAFYVGTGDFSLKITEVQLEGKAKTSVDNFLRGYSLKEGDIFESTAQ
ncbi:MAG: methionyl-tRNA formyltransferase [Bdellovibrionota bacterium]